MNMQTNTELPLWLQTKNQTNLNFEKKHDFVGINITSLGKLLHFFTNITPVYRVKTSPWLRVCTLLITSLLVLLSRNLIFLWACLLIILGELALFRKCDFGNLQEIPKIDHFYSNLYFA